MKGKIFNAKLKIGQKAVLVNMGFIHKGYLAYDESDTLFSEVKIEKITEDGDGEFWINSKLRQKYVFEDMTQAKNFVSPRGYFRRGALQRLAASSWATIAV